MVNINIIKFISIKIIDNQYNPTIFGCYHKNINYPLIIKTQFNYMCALKGDPKIAFKPYILRNSLPLARNLKISQYLTKPNGWDICKNVLGSLGENGTL